ncbi:MAG: hypothetical protein MUO89_00280 [Dehalococcoidia bacterium]|nr:hypothetical protein [Dehalococcoidia bacterium]
MADIKSAWEIAQEKAGRLGQLSPEERERQRQDRCRVIGESLAEKYLNQHDIGIFKEELRNHSAQDKDLINQAAVHRLIQDIKLQYPQVLTAISRGILILADSVTATKTLDQIKELFQEYAEAENKEKQEIEKAGGEMLHQLRISGTAISHLNIRAKEEWEKKLDQTAHPFDERLHRLNQELQHR